MNSDGYSDVVVSAPNFQNPAGRGRIFAYLGSGMGLRSFSAWTADGTNYLADSLAPAGDVNGDGFDDVIAGSDTDANNRGAIYIFQGGPRLGAYDTAFVSSPGQFQRDGATAIGEQSSTAVSQVVFKATLTTLRAV